MWVLLLYGRAMLSGQTLEFSVFQLTQLERPAPKDFERAMRQIEGLLKQPRGDQAKNLRRLGEDMRSELLAALELRNRLAHDFLMEYRMTRAVDDNAVTWATGVLREAISSFDDLNRELDRHAETALADAGVPELSEEEEAEIIASLERWSQDLLRPEQADPPGDEAAPAES